MLQFDQLSYWEKKCFLGDIDLLIVGSGIVGLSTAIHQKKSFPKKKIVIIERGYLPSGASTKNAGFACIGSPSELLSDLRKSPEDLVWNTVAKRWQGLQSLRSLLGAKEIDFQACGSFELFRPSEKKRFQECQDQLYKLNRKLGEITGLKEVYHSQDQIIEQSDFKGFRYAIANTAEGMLDTGKMMNALMKKAYHKGVIILNGISCNKIEEGFVVTNFGDIKCDQIAICTNGLAAKLLQLEVKPARAQVVVTSELQNMPFNSCFHFDEGYYYFRNIGKRILLGGGRNRDFEAEETDELNTSDPIINHLSYLLETQIIPEQAFTIEHRWAGTMGVGKHKAPIVKALNSNTYCAVRLGGMGVAIGSLVGKELSELIGG